MKMLQVVLSLYFFSASAFPCSDISSTLFSVHGEHATQQTETGNTDDCSTLCVCTCCGIVCTVVTTVDSLSVPYVHSIVILATLHKPLSQFSNSIWQPPKA